MSDDKAMERRPDNLIRRRTALAKLGLSVPVVYATLTIVHLDRSANAWASVL
jgi:predicted DNA-binding transcriptional regulator AlpA